VQDRLAALDRWLAAVLAGAPYERTLAAADASPRRYHRVRLGEGRSYVAMDAPPACEDCRPFVRVAALLRAAGVNAPRVHAQDLAQGFLLLDDLGTRTYLEAFSAEDAAHADRLMHDAISALVRWQLASRPGVLPPYDEALLRRELELFALWYAERHLGRALDAALRAAFDAVATTLVRCALAQPRVYVHRDYMPRNLMCAEPNPGVLDFQDATYGPIAYDLVSLLRDAFVSWDEEQVRAWARRYWEAARAARLPVAGFAEFWRDFEWTGLQRHLKVLGVFARLSHRDGKPRYLADAPRFVGYARAVARRWRELAPLARLLDALECDAPAAA